MMSRGSFRSGKAALEKGEQGLADLAGLILLDEMPAGCYPDQLAVRYFLMELFGDRAQVEVGFSADNKHGHGKRGEFPFDLEEIPVVNVLCKMEKSLPATPFEHGLHEQVHKLRGAPFLVIDTPFSMSWMAPRSRADIMIWRMIGVRRAVMAGPAKDRMQQY